jgi:hypothetical protein
MMLQQIREDLKEVLTGITPQLYTYEPERPVPSCIIITAATSFLRINEGDFGPSYTSNWRLQPIVKVAVNQIETSNLDETIMEIVQAVWQVEGVATVEVDKPFIVELNGASYLSTYINVQMYSQGGI